MLIHPIVETALTKQQYFFHFVTGDMVGILSLILTSSFDRLEEIVFNRVSKVEDVHQLDFVDTKLQTKHGHKYREWCGLCRPNSTCKHDTKSQVLEIYKDTYFSGKVRDKQSAITVILLNSLWYATE